MNALKDDRGTVDVSLYILSFNRAKYLAEAVKSALNQTYRPRDIIILDNGSKADVKTVVEPYLEEGVKWIGSDSANSPFWNVRRAFKNAQGKYFVVMHDDDHLAKNFLKEQAEFLDRNADVVAVACNAYQIDAEGNRICPLLPRSKKEISLLHNSAEAALIFSCQQGFSFPSIMYRNGSAQKVEFRDEEFGPVSDTIYLCDLAQVGPLAYQDKLLYEYRIHANQESRRMPEQIMRHRDKEFLRLASSDPLILKKVIQNVSAQQMLRIYSALVKRILKDREIASTIFDQKEQFRPEIFTLGGLFFGTMAFSKKIFYHIYR